MDLQLLSQCGSTYNCRLRFLDDADGDDGDDDNDDDDDSGGGGGGEFVHVVNKL